jgi:hypothetical protein
MYFFCDLSGAWSLLATLIFMSGSMDTVQVYLALLTKAANSAMMAAGGY